ncbi:hypothetical protein [Mesorhizobium sp. GbtcB19]|uniref:hypothetical protein n=1 Tax=Mesorhizobium sp. GbtcB19 TaxID=2824764 RepID=UPI001C2F3F59|nr:hypothetical protein [Mesorhizobium sp. GbtcB19]
MINTKRVRNNLKRSDGTPWPFGSVLSYVSDRIRQASLEGKGLRLTAEEVRALEWAVIREEGGVDADHFREASYDALSPFFDEQGGLTEAGIAALKRSAT